MSFIPHRLLLIIWTAYWP